MRDFKGTICAVGGGKGGVGKSLVAVNTACALALDGYEVILVDADLAGANVIGGGWTIDRLVARHRAEELKEAYEVAAPSVDTQARLLSGGNLQRLILAREISSGPGLMVAVQPTRGFDVGSIETVHRLLLEQRAEGTAILLISEDLDEILMLADRVAVIYEGHISQPVTAADADIAELGLLMTGPLPAGRTDSAGGPA